MSLSCPAYVRWQSFPTRYLSSNKPQEGSIAQPESSGRVLAFHPLPGTCRHAALAAGVSRAFDKKLVRRGLTHRQAAGSKGFQVAASNQTQEATPLKREGEGYSFRTDNVLNASSSMALTGLVLGCSLLVASALAEPANAVSLDRLHVPLDQDMQALAFNFDPLYDEFWENVQRWILYFFSVTSGGFYMLVKPLGDLFKKPVTAALTVVILGGSFYLVFTVLQLMLGIVEA